MNKSHRLLIVLFSVTLTFCRPILGHDIDEYDRICADHMVMVFHAYDQVMNQQEINFREPVQVTSRFLKIVPYEIRRDAVEETLFNGWTFRPFYGHTGAQFWRQRSLMGMVAYHENHHILSITYRGTQQFSDMWNNLNFLRGTSDNISERMRFHSGYLAVFEQSLPSLREVLDDFKTTQTEESLHQLTVLITGYSLGGSTAAIAAVFLRDYFPEASLRLSIFGAPCVGSEALNDWLEQQKIVAKSFVRKTDYTPYNPSCYWLQYVGSYIELPDYGDWSLAWPMAHDCRKYQQAIYEILNQNDQYNSLFYIQIPWLGNRQF